MIDAIQNEAVTPAADDLNPLLMMAGKDDTDLTDEDVDTDEDELTDEDVDDDDSDEDEDDEE